MTGGGKKQKKNSYAVSMASFAFFYKNLKIDAKQSLTNQHSVS